MLAGPAETLPRTVEELLGRDLAARLDRLDLLSRKMLAGKLPGERRSKRRGRSVEFDDFRDYVPGDDLRHIDWNVLARLDKLFIKLFREEEDLALHIIVDASASMNAGGNAGGNAGTPNKLVYAHQLAMALAYVGVVKQNRVSVATFGVPPTATNDLTANRAASSTGFLRQLSPVRGRGGVHHVAAFLLESLGAAQQASTGSPGVGDAPDISRALRTFARTRRGKGIAVVLSDFLTPVAEVSPLIPGLNAIALTEAGGFDSYCLQILSPGELDPRPLMKLGGGRGLIGDVRLTDVETGRAAEVSISPALIAKYRERVDRYIADLRRTCRARGIGHFLVPTSTPIDELVVTSLRRGGMLR
jgi:uncharacterized protein (DUF58 family)